MIRIILISLSLLISTKTFSQEIDFNKFDTLLFAKKFIDLCNKERTDNEGKELTLYSDGMKASNFHCDYNAYNNILTHTQTTKFRGLTLKNPSDRLKYFTKVEFKLVSEIISKGEFTIVNKITYDFLARKTFRIYMMSEPHRNIIMSDLDKDLYISPGINITFVDNKITFYTCFLIFR